MKLRFMECERHKSLAEFDPTPSNWKMLYVPLKGKIMNLLENLRIKKCWVWGLIPTCKLSRLEGSGLRNLRCH